MKPVSRLLAVFAALIALSLFAVACGDDEEEGSGSGSEETTQTQPPEESAAKAVTLTADEYTFDLSATPTPDTKKVTFKNEGEQFHVMIFARINEGFTLDEAFRMQGRGGSTEEIAVAEAGPGKTKTVQITKPLEPGTYAMLCPIPSPKGPHYKRGQLQEFEIS